MRNNSLFAFIIFAAARQCKALFSDEENAVLPVLFHLDDYERCLLQKDGLYCLGEFDLAPIGTISPIYEAIKNYSADIAAFNRSLIYRGYCVSERCPQQEVTTTIAEKNASRRFEQCVSMRTRRFGLRARLRALQYCTTRHQRAEKLRQPRDDAQQLFLQVVCALLALNIIGTMYDFGTGDKKKNNIIVAWSVRASWRRLTATYDDGDPRLKQLEAFHGMRVLITLMTIYCHTWVQQYQFYVTNPQVLEQLYREITGIVLSSGTGVTQWFVMTSSFLTAYNILIYSEKHHLSLSMLPIMVIKRIIRIAPVHFMLVGFAATYWPEMRQGPFSPVIEEFSTTCRRKFWSHTLFLNNVIDKQNICLMPTWVLPVDMHLYIISCALTIMMSRRRHQALHLYGALFVFTSLFCGLVAYITGWQSIVYISVPQNIRGLFRNTASFSEFYTSTWSALPACFVGLFFAHLHYELQQKGYDWKHNQRFRRFYPWLSPIGASSTFFLGVLLRQFPMRWVTTLCVIIDRPLYSFCHFLFMLGIINYSGRHNKFFSWRGWRVPARLSLPMTLCHWIISVAIVARPIAYHTSKFDVSIDFTATIVYGYAISVPVALLVEIPVQRFFAQLF